jgi:PST family polysaccharide transporter
VILTKKNSINALFLSIVQGINYIVPLIVVPILINYLGIDEFGRYSFVLAIVTLLSFIIDGGFGIYGSKKISTIIIKRGKLSSVISYLYYSVFIYKLFFFFVISTTYLFLIIFVDKLNANFELMIPSILFFLSFVFNVDWYYQGVQRTLSLLIVTALSKLIFVISILSVNELDSFSAMMILSLSMLLSNLFLFFKESIRLPRSFIKLYNYSKLISNESRKYLTSKLSIELYRGLPAIVLGLIFNTTIVSYYVIADKIITAIQSLQIPFGKALLPSAIEQVNKFGLKIYLARVIKLYQFLLVVYLITIAFVYYMSPTIVELMTGEDNVNIINNIRFMSIVIFIGGSNYFIGVIALLPSKEDIYYTRTLSAVGLSSVIFLYFFIYNFGDKGAVLSVVLSELAIFILFSKRFLEIWNKVK